MRNPTIPENEKERLDELNSYSILDTLSESDYDNLTSIASEICGTPISLITLIDESRQWFKSHHGLAVKETPREYAFCAHAINNPNDVFVVEDARKDERFHDNPFVIDDPRVIFYAGIPLVSQNGFPLGTLCVIDHEPKQLSPKQIKSLTALSKQVMKLLELRRSQFLLEKALLSVEEKNEELQTFAYVAAHDLKSPLNNIARLTELFSTKYKSVIDANGLKILDLINSSSETLKRLVDDLLTYSKNNSILQESKTSFDLEKLKNEVVGLLTFDAISIITLQSELTEVCANRTALELILINIVSNAIKYNDKVCANIEIGASEDQTHYQFYVQDNGPGIEPNMHAKIFELFAVGEHKDQFGQAGNGIGLATVDKLVMALGGTIYIESKIGLGSRFSFSIKK